MPRQPLIVGRPAVIVIDIQMGSFIEGYDVGIAKMAGFNDNMRRARQVIDAARTTRHPVIFIQEAHRPDGVDFGRELDGNETEHCVEGRPGTELAAEITGYRPGDYFIRKRRYSAFFGTDLEILLKGLKTETLILVGSLTDVCVHYTFVDAHQHDYHVRVAEDGVGGSTPEAHEASLRAMEYLQNGARQSVATLADALTTAERPLTPA
ncbi:MAG: isochorismatase family cysteine hydrolase [Pseudomonadota bacterium]